MSVCIGCVLGAGTFITMWSSGRLIEWKANFQRRRAMRLVEQESCAAATASASEAAESQRFRFALLAGSLTRK